MTQHLVALVFTLAAGFASAQQVTVPTAAASKDTLGTGDGVRVTVFQNPDFTTEARLSERGTIVFPLVGEIELAGLTAAQAGERIAERLKQEKLVVNPQVTVALTNLKSRQVSVLGQVAKPGKYPLEDASPRLQDVLALAGGVNATGADSVTVVGADGKRREVSLGTQADTVAIAPGDTVYVNRAPVFYIYGEVQKAGAYRLEPNMMVMQALSVGGGITPRGTQRGLKIHRPGADGKVQRLDATLVDTLQPNDTLYVRESLF